MSMIVFPVDVACEAKAVVSEVVPDGLGIWGPATNRFQGGLDQGWALEKLSHAVQYLADSRMFDFDARRVREGQEAVQILMRMSRAIFSECTEVVALKRGEDLVTRGIVGRHREAIGLAELHYT